MTPVLPRVFATRRRLIIAVSAALAIIFIILLVIATSRYPIALVNGQAVSSRRFSLNYQSAWVYYRNAQKTYGPSGSATETQSSPDPAADVLNRLVEAELIHQELERQLGGETAFLVQGKIGKYREDRTLRQAAATLYNLEYPDFEREVLQPQAEKDILAGRLFLGGKLMEDWLTAAKKSARVVIFSNKFRWDGEKVAAN